MKVWRKLGGCLLLLVGCRQPNPEWTGSDTVVDSDTGPSNMSMPADGSTSLTTEGQDCNNDNQCPNGWVCGPMGCQQGVDGDPCDGDGDCQAPTGICGPDGTCQGGDAGDACVDNSDCTAPTAVCGPEATCHVGQVGDPCTTPAHCMGGLMCTDGACA